MAKNAVFRLEGDGLPDDAAPVAYEAVEAISHPFDVTVEFTTESADFQADALLRKPLLLTIIDERARTRCFHGVVQGVRFLRVSGPKFYFAARLRPALAALAHRADCRIFQTIGVVDIAAKIFDEAGFLDSVRWQLTGSYPPRDFTCQYRESSLAFVSRLFEDEGIFYFFEHTPDGHVLVVADSSDAFVPTAGAPPAVLTLAANRSTAGDSVRDFSRTRSLRPSHVVLRDYDFERPQVHPRATATAAERWPRLHDEYPGGFVDVAQGEQRAAARLRELRRDADVCRGTSSAIGLRCGVPFLVENAAEATLNGEYVVTQLTSRGRQNAEDEDENFACQNEFAGIPKGAPYAPPRFTPRPRIRGVQTAVVTGPSAQDQSVFVDKYGRVKVHFHWDRTGQFDENASTWLRTTHPPTSGSIAHPRAGWEVAVAFLDGDPDRPIVLGRFYNGDDAPPYPLPAQRASGGIKTMSSPGGAGHNEIRMSDSGGSQGFAVHAQKDFNVTIGHDKSEEVAVDETHRVKVNLNVTIGANESRSVGGDRSVDVGANLSHKVGGDQRIAVSGNDTSNSDCDAVEVIRGKRAYTVNGGQLTISTGVENTVGGNISRQVGAAHVSASVGSIADTIVGDLGTKVTGATIQIAKGSISESVGGSKNLTSVAAEAHLVKGGHTSDCKAGVTSMIAGLHYEKVGGSYSVKAPVITLVGAVGEFKVGESSVKLGGKPVVIHASSIALEAMLITKTAASLKMGSG